MNNAKLMVKTAFEALDDKKGFDIKILDISHLCTLVDYFIIVDGTNKNQIQALCDNVEEKMSANGFKTKSIEGYSAGGWILMDYYDIIIHIFSDEARRFYDIERIWGDGKIININSI